MMKTYSKFGFALAAIFTIALFGFGTAIVADDSPDTDTDTDTIDTSNALCPVSGNAVDPEATASHNGGTIYFCCGKCPKAFASNTAKYATKANQQLAVTGQATQNNCPISGGKTKAATALAVGGIDVTFCCNKCRGKVNAATGDDQLNLVFGDDAFAKAFTVGASSE